MESAFGHHFGHVRIHADADAASEAHSLGARAFTVGADVAFGRDEYRPGTLAGDLLLAHELAHVVQQDGRDTSESPPLRKSEDASGLLEQDADRSALAAISTLWGDQLGLPKQSARPAARSGPQLQRCGASPKKAEPPLTHDQMLVERAKRMLPILEQYEREWAEREMRRLDEKDTRDKMLASRDAIEDPLAKLQGRPEMEADRIAKLNRRPLHIEVSEKKVVFRVKFQARFEDPAQKGNFGKLRSAVQAAARDVWNRDVDKVMVGKTFEVIPELSLISEKDKRDLDYWLITVRPDDHSPVTYPGCKLDDPLPTVAAVTDPLCAGGVMNLPPGSVGNASLIGHELLHLFGLVDRYMMTQTQMPDGKVETGTIPMRETGGRRDPLGGDKGFVLLEDLAFLFDRLGVYDIEANRGLATLRELEQKGMRIGAVRREIEHQKEIIRLGRDPRSLIPLRTDFTDKMIKTAEDL
jgi:Domain of unknown function (DUF4157)